MTSSARLISPRLAGSDRDRIAGRRPGLRGHRGMALLPATPISVSYHQPRGGKKIATAVLESFPSCPIPEIARLGRTLRAWRDAVPGLLHHRAGQQRRHRSRQRHHRAPPPHRPRLPQPPQLPTTDDLGRRTTHPPESPMSPFDEPRHQRHHYHLKGAARVSKPKPQ